MRALKLSVLHVARALGLFRLFQHFTRHKIRILCYHGGCIGDESTFNSLLFCSGEFLDKRLSWLRDKGFTVISLPEAVQLLESNKRRPHLPTVLTFDDGWYSTYRALHPVILRHNVPATLYLCTSYYLEKRPNLDIALGYILWRAGRKSVEIRDVNAQIDGTYDLGNEADRRRLQEVTTAWLRTSEMVRADVCATLEQICQQMGLAAAEIDLASRRFDFVLEDELKEMVATGWSIQLHGHLHRYLANQPEAIAADVGRCREEICRSGLPEANHYCYPSGNFDADAYRNLAAVGVQSATTCIPGLIDSADQRQKFYLGRFLDGERVHALEFESEMSGLADFLRRLIRRHQ